MNAENKYDIENGGEVEKKRSWFSRNKNAIMCGLTLAAGVAIGWKYSSHVMNKGLELVFETDPTVKDHLATAIAETTKNNLMKN